jgi:UDP:flavonoid glycosyltransferase YjiC (YdhE family)
MRILFAFVGGRGHAEPLIPVARAAAAAGHTTAFTGRPGMAETIEGLGLDFFPTGPSSGNGPPVRIPLRKLDPEKEDRDLREGFARRLARARAADVAALCADWQPDLIVCDEIDFGSMIAAERLGLPYASVLVIAAGSFVRREVVGQALNEVRREHGLPPDPELAMLSRHLVLSPFPPSYRDPAFPLPATSYSFRPVTVEQSTSKGAPIVYFTLGTVFNLESGDLFTRVLAGLAALPIEAVATVGNQIDPEELGTFPDNVRVERFIDQSLVLPRCSAVVSHGGSGTVAGALAHGLPLVLMPMGADQPMNAARCEELGVARVLDALSATPAAITEAVSDVLSDLSYRSAAER